MMKKVVFVINNIQNPRCLKRINEFVDKGYEIKVYAFDRGGEMYDTRITCPIHYIKGFSNDLPYLKRLPIIYQGIQGIIRENRSENGIYYLFGLEICILLAILSPASKYIYEESDLTHTYLPSAILRWVFEKIDRWVIRRSLLTVFTSEGFRKYHYGDFVPANTCIIPNRLPAIISTIERIPKEKHDKLTIGFVGHIRFESVKSFAETFCRYNTKHEFHFYGDFASLKEQDLFESLKHYGNCFFHGKFSTPYDLPYIYSKIDLVLATYDVKYKNVRYAEPNKLYEAIYFETPIIVSEGCFLGEKVKRLNVGYTVDALNETKIQVLLDEMSHESIRQKVRNMRKLGTDYAINSNEHFFQELANYQK